MNLVRKLPFFILFSIFFLSCHVTVSPQIPDNKQEQEKPDNNSSNNPPTDNNSQNNNPSEQNENKTYLHVKKTDYTKENLNQILSKETSDEMSKLFFYTNEPLQVSYEENNKLQIISYAPVKIENVTIQVKTENKDESYKTIAIYDEIYGFSKSSMSLPKELAITNKNPEFKIIIENNDFWNKIKTIKNPLKITFAQGDGGPWKSMTPTAGRKAVIVGTTMSYMFNHKDYKEHLKNWNEGGYKDKEVIYSLIPGVPGAPVFVWLPSAPFKDDKGNPLSYEIVYNQTINKGGINFSLIKDTEPAGGIGGGNILGFRENLFDNFLKYNTLPFNGKNQKELKCYTIDVIFHELAHCMGYYHPNDPKTEPYYGTMTYGGGWTTANYVFLNKLVEKGDLPIILDGKWAEKTGFPELKM